AITMGDFVDQDDLYPYCPTQRVRKDATSVLKLSAHRRPKQRATTESADSMDSKPSGFADKHEEDSELVVVLTRWYLIRLRRPGFDISKELFHAVAKDQRGGLDVLLRTMHQGIFPTAKPWSSS
ncbi:hypothetical protein Gpo141_00012438, partial [Globisporangium polare]